MELAAKLNLAMREIGVENVAEIARRARVSRSSCYRWFDGKAWPELREAKRLAEVLKVPLEFLADDLRDFPPEMEPQLEQDESMALEIYREIREAVGSTQAIRELHRAADRVATAVASGGSSWEGGAGKDASGKVAVVEGEALPPKKVPFIAGSVRDTTALDELHYQEHNRPKRQAKAAKKKRE